MKPKLIILSMSLIFTRSVTALEEDEICAPSLDLVFILDTSGSVEEIYNEHIRWTVALAESLPIHMNAVRVATIQYAGYPLTEFSLNAYNDKSDVVKHLHEMSFKSGVTRTGFALRRADDELFDENRGARKNASKIIALFTDGLSIDDPIKPSDYLRHRKGVKIYVVSVNAEGFVREMQRIAGENENVYGPNDSISLKNQLLKDVDNSRICESDIIRTGSRSTKIIASTPISSSDSVERIHESTTNTDFPNLTTINQLQKKKTRRILRRKLKRVPGKIRKESLAKNRRVIRKKMRKMVSQSTSSPVLRTPEISPLMSTRNMTSTRRASTTQQPYHSTSLVDIPASTTTTPIKSTVRTTQNPQRLGSSVLYSNSANAVTRSRTTSNVRALSASLAFSSKRLQGNVIPLPKCPLDILFIVDSSGSVGKIYEKQKEFLSDLLLSIDPENQNHRVALIQFAGAKLQKTEWTFDSYHENSQIMEAFDKVRHFTGTTYIGAALELALQLLNGRRPDVLTLVILLSDGYSQDNAIQPAEMIRSMENVEFYAISLSRYNNSNYLRQMVKDDEKMSVDKEDVSSIGNHLKSRLYCENQ